MTMARSVGAEVLDGLAADDPAAMRSRRDLRRLHRLMGTRRILARALQDMLPAPRGSAPLRLLELGAGDGSLMLGVARSLAPAWPPVELTLLDAQPLLDTATIAGYAALGWNAIAHVGDVFDWVGADSHAMPDGCSANDTTGGSPANDATPGGQAVRSWDLVLANLFLHHFETPQLGSLLRAVARRSHRFLACEPRRAGLALAASRLVGAVGANAVTREDAVLSVRAGFRGAELSALWPAAPGTWRLREYSAGLFSHCFRAQAIGPR